MKSTRLFIACAALAIAACTAAVEGGPEAAADDFAQTEQGLELKVKELFGPEARVGRIFGRGSELLVGVALEPKTTDSDVPEPLALASFERAAGNLSVVSAAAGYREAARLGAQLAVVTTEGELKVQRTDGAEQLLASSVKGELWPAGNGSLLFTAEPPPEGERESAVMVALADGAVQLVADGDRGSVSPDGTTVLFVSGRTGVASLFRTSLAGGDPVQLTNVGMQLPDVPELLGDEAEATDRAPEGFVPPPVSAEALTWVSEDVVRYDAGGGELWRVNVRTGEAKREGGAP